ncbi:MAG: ABC transporter permease [Bifidobacteriaceae bacterium]|jgi:ABC-type multidrug transport system permease subunit|nr:ABC transporter permease [Bifidobacteriaceae bacterium]
MRQFRAFFGVSVRELARDPMVPICAFVAPLGLFWALAALGSRLCPQVGQAPPQACATPAAVFMAVSGAGLTLSSGRLASLRALGLLQLLNTTPAREVWFVSAYLLARLAGLQLQVVGIAAIAWAAGQVGAAQLLPLAGAALVCLALFLGVGVILGSLVDPPELATALGAAGQLAAMASSGVVIPLAAFPEPAAKIMAHLPTTYLADFLAASLGLAPAAHPPAVATPVALGGAAAVLAGAAAAFRWEAGRAR